jgi:hypothetical protein
VPPPSPCRHCTRCRPEHGYTKRDLLDYYREIAPVMLPYLVDRPQVLHRHVDGHSGKEFFQRVSRTTPSWLKTTEITLEDGRKRDFHLCQDWPTLLWLANFGCIELIPWNSRLGSLDRPDYAVIDLDPIERCGKAIGVRRFVLAKTLAGAYHLLRWASWTREPFGPRGLKVLHAGLCEVTLLRGLMTPGDYPMDWSTQWLTRENAAPATQDLLDLILRRFRERESNQYAELNLAWAQAAYNLRREWFRVSIGLEFVDGDRETICLSEAKGIGNIGNIENIVPFTHWLGSLYAALRYAAQSGQYPRELQYGPPGREKVRPVGPLTEYSIENSSVREAAFFWTDLPYEKKREADRVTEPATARSSLAPIWLNIDPVQDRNFRWPFHGIYVLTGGPGTGKTSVALCLIILLFSRESEWATSRRTVSHCFAGVAIRDGCTAAWRAVTATAHWRR